MSSKIDRCKFFLPALVTLLIFNFLTNQSFAAILGSTNPFCSNSGEVLCNENYRPICSDAQFKPACLNGSPNCCNENFTPATCDSSLIKCEFASEIKPGTVVDVEILASPILPDFFNSPEDDSKFEKITGIAYVGSNPSFEINLKTSEENIKILSVDLQDSSGTTFKNLPFNVVDKSDNSRIKNLTLSIPSISPGGATFILNLVNNTTLSGLLEIKDFFNFQTPNNTQEILEPIISKINVAKKNNKFILNVHGENFAPNEIIITKQGSEEKIVHKGSKEFPNTTITLFPSDIKLKLVKLKASKNGKLLQVQFIQTGKISNDTEAILVVSTPRGIVSKSFVLKNVK